MKKSKYFFGILTACLSLVACSSNGENPFNGGGNPFGGSTANYTNPSNGKTNPFGGSTANNTNQSGMEQKQYDVTINVTGNGTVMSDVNKAYVGEVVTFAVIPDDGYYLSGFYVNNVAREVMSNVYKTTMDEGGLFVRAYFSYSDHGSPSNPPSYNSSYYGGYSSSDYYGSSRSSKHIHYASDDAPWLSDESRHWQECAAGDGGKVNVKAHSYPDINWQVLKEASCAEVGYRWNRCEVCGYEVTEEIPLQDHTWGEWEVLAEADCDNAGSRKRVCSVCGWEETEVIEALGHNWSEWDIIESPSCEKEGSRRHTCTRCYKQVTETIKPLGHDYHMIDPEVTPEAGKAKVRLYECARCGNSFMGFKATEVTEASKSHLVFETDPDNGDVGARFWGRPIGNGMELDETGTAYGGDSEKIFDRNETGDFFEYVFDLTSEQAEQLKNCRCYCDARAADYLNGQDFWAREPGAAEWTPGYYIDFDHPDATPIEDYRYILYVDDYPVQFDPTITAPVPEEIRTSIPRREYVMPYLFHLHPGENKISLRMAGGYRSIFFNFIFRPYDQSEGGDTPIEINVVKNWTMDEIKAYRSDSGWADDKDWGNGVTGFKFNKAGGNFTVFYTSPIQEKVTLQLMIAVKYSNASVTGFWQQSSTEKTAIYFNGSKLAKSDEPDFTIVEESDINDNGRLSIPMWFDICDLSLLDSENSLNIEFITGGYSYYICGARLVK